MESPLMIALSRADALSRQMDILANNIANTSTRGYKAERMMFELAEKKPVAGQPLDFVVDRSSYRDFSAGSVEQTGNPLDASLNGDGFFSVRRPDGEIMYTRNGAFTINPDGFLTDQMGNLVLGEGGAEIGIPTNTTHIDIGIDGTISTDTAVVGKLEVSLFDAPQKLKPFGDTFFRAEGAVPVPNDGGTRILQGTIEGSNVMAVREMTEMMEVTRQYQSAQRILDTEHDRIRDAISKLGRVA